MGIDAAEYHGEAQHEHGTYRYEEWVSPLAANAKKVPFFLQAFGFLLALIGAIMLGAKNGAEDGTQITSFRLFIAPSAAQAQLGSGWAWANGIESHNNHTDVSINANLGWIIAAGVVAIIFIIIGWLEPMFSSEGSYGAGIGLFIPVSGIYVYLAHDILDNVSDFIDPSNTAVTSGTDRVIIAGLLLLFIGGVLAVISFMTIAGRQARPAVMGATAFVWLFEIIAAIILAVYSQGQSDANDAALSFTRQNWLLFVIVPAFIQAFWFLGAGLYDHRCFFHANAAFAGYFSWYIMSLALALDAQNRDLNTIQVNQQAVTAGTISFQYDVPMVAYAMLWIAQALIIIISIIFSPRYALWEQFDEKVFGAKKDNDRETAEHVEDIDEEKKGLIRARRGYSGTWRPITAIALTVLAAIAAIIFASQGAGTIANWRIAQAVIACALFSVGLWTGRWTASNAGAGIVIVSSGQYLRDAWFQYQIIKTADDNNVNLSVAVQNPTEVKLAAFCICIVAMWLIPLLHIDPKAIKKNRVGGAQYASIALAIILWIGAIIVWSQGIEYHSVYPGIVAFPVVPAFFTTTEVFVLGFFLIWAVIGYHCPTVCSVNFFVGYELFQTLSHAISWYKFYGDIVGGTLFFKNLATTSDADKQVFRDYVVAGFAIMFAGLLITWIYLLVAGPDCRPPAPAEKPEAIVERYTYTPGYYEYTYTSVYVSGSDYASQSYY